MRLSSESNWGRTCFFHQGLQPCGVMAGGGVIMTKHAIVASYRPCFPAIQERSHIDWPGLHFSRMLVVPVVAANHRPCVATRTRYPTLLREMFVVQPG